MRSDEGIDCGHMKSWVVGTMAECQLEKNLHVFPVHRPHVHEVLRLADEGVQARFAVQCRRVGKMETVI